MPARMSIKELVELINVTKAGGNDTTILEQLLAEVNPVTPDKPAKKKHHEVLTMEPQKDAPALVSSPQELERLRVLACPHIKSSPFWEEFIARRVLVCNSCKELRPGEFGEHRQPTLFDEQAELL